MRGKGERFTIKRAKTRVRLLLGIFAFSVSNVSNALHDSNDSNDSNGAFFTCPAGTFMVFSDDDGAASCNACPVGKYSASQTAHRLQYCIPCPLGTYAAGNKTEAISAEEAGCTPCPSGTTGRQEGTSSIEHGCWRGTCQNEGGYSNPSNIVLKHKYAPDKKYEDRTVTAGQDGACSVAFSPDGRYAYVTESDSLKTY